MNHHPLDPYWPALRTRERGQHLLREAMNARAALTLVRDAIDGGRDLMADEDWADVDAACEQRLQRYRELEPILAEKYDSALRDYVAFQVEHAL